MNIIRLLIIVLLASLTAFAAQAKEVIKSFNVELIAQANGDYSITENITVNVEGRQIKRGIFRELPRYQMYQGEKIPVRYNVKSIGRDTHREDYAIEKDGNAFRLRIGDADRFLTHKDHTYQITYTIKDDLRRDTEYDEIYWNATGNYWAFPIETSRIDITVPEAARLISSDAFTGRLGSTANNTQFSQNGNKYSFVSTHAFDSKEGMTVSLKFEKGVFEGIQAETKRYIWRLKNAALLILSLSLLGIVGYYYRSWNKVGRDPVKGPVFARYEPPKDYSAAAASHIYYRAISGHKALTATLVGLANKGWISIDTDKKKTVLTPLDRDINEHPPASAFEFTREMFAALVKGDKKTLKEMGVDLDINDEDVDPSAFTSPDKEALNAEEAHLFSKLFPSSRYYPITLKKEVNTEFNSAYASFQRALGRNYGEPYYKLNGKYIGAGIALSILAVAITFSQISTLTPDFVWLLFAALLAANIIFLFLMPAPTKKGQKIRTELEGFRLFMKTAEKQKFDSVEVGSEAPPPMSVKRYEELLPYAIALGVEKPWSKYFEKVMPMEAKDYQPVWGGSSHNFGSVSRMTDNMVSNISSGVSSAQPQSSGSSGSGGGGFSGGGGGGGGGGGW